MRPEFPFHVLGTELLAFLMSKAETMRIVPEGTEDSLQILIHGLPGLSWRIVVDGDGSTILRIAPHAPQVTIYGFVFLEELMTRAPDEDGATSALPEKLSRVKFGFCCAEPFTQMMRLGPSFWTNPKPLPEEFGPGLLVYLQSS